MATATSATEVRVPDIGDFSDVPIIEIMVSPGDTVAAEDPLVTLESDKATMDVPSPQEGVVQELKVNVGDTVSEGSVLLTLLPAGADEERAEESVLQPAAEEAAADEQPPGGGAPEAAAPAEAPPPAAPAAAPPSPPAAAERSFATAYASPGVRRLARELGVDLGRIQGTGRKGRITREDVERAKAGPPAEAAAQAAPAKGAPAGDGALLGLPPWPSIDFEKFGPVEREPLTRIKKISGPVLARNWVMIPHVTHHEDADITELEAFRKRTNEEYAKRGVKLTMVALLLKACVASLKQFPQFNASLDGDELVLKRYYHLGFAADTPQGLVVPVIRDVDQKGLIQIAEELTALSGKAREGKLGPSEMAGGTFTISSLGGLGGTGFTPIVNAPEVAILGVTKSAMKPVWNGSEFVPRLIVPLSLSYDHRVIDGALAARFATHLAGVLSDMRRGLL
jgi:pyruvate dehydrogenase E2 component (dihydrolipoyllysine-residue acetyltransferase)